MNRRSGIRGSLAIRSEGKSPVPYAGALKQGCGGRLAVTTVHTRAVKVYVGRFRGRKASSDFGFESIIVLRFSGIASRVRWPNKALEPTLTVGPCSHTKS